MIDATYFGKMINTSKTTYYIRILD